MKQIAKQLNLLSDFCGLRDIETLTTQALEKNFSLSQVDILVLFGGSILSGGDLLATAMHNHLAKKYIIVGGHGHTTQRLKDQIKKVMPYLQVDQKSEAELFAAYLQEKYQLSPDLLETKSTNCGNNITLMLELIENQQLPIESILLMQDATMQRRMAATLEKYARPCLKILNFATYKAQVTAANNNQLKFTEEITGMWEMADYIQLLMGEIPRLTDDANGYGPKGAHYLAHVEIPSLVQESFQSLLKKYPEAVRIANPAFSSNLNLP